MILGTSLPDTDQDPMSSPEPLDDVNRPSSSNSLHDDSNAKSRSRTRTNFNLRQLHGLEKYFQENHSPDLKAREEIGRDLQLSERSVRYWFQNRRQKIRELYKNTETSTLGLLGSSSQPERRISESSTHTTPPAPQPVAPRPQHGYPYAPGPASGGPPRAPPPYGVPEPGAVSELGDSMSAGCMAYGPRQGYHHTCCACMSEMSYLIAQLHAAVPGIGPHAAPTDVLHATIAYVHAVQLAVGMRDTAARQYGAREEVMPWGGARAWSDSQGQQPPKWGHDAHSISPPT